MVAYLYWCWGIFSGLLIYIDVNWHVTQQRERCLQGGSRQFKDLNRFKVLHQILTFFFALHLALSGEKSISKFWHQILKLAYVHFELNYILSTKTVRENLKSLPKFSNLYPKILKLKRHHCLLLFVLRYLLFRH